MASAELVRLPSEAGEPERFTTRDMLDTERSMLAVARKLGGQNQSHEVPASLIEEVTQELSDEGRGAKAYALVGPSLVVIEGNAGAGKSTMLAHTRRGWEKAGFRAVGAALSGKAAEGLGQTTGMETRSGRPGHRVWGSQPPADGGAYRGFSRPLRPRQLFRA